MTQPPHDEPTARSQEELREQVERTRHELGDTVQELADRADVKTRAREKALAVREQAGTKAHAWRGQVRTKAAHVAHAVEEKLPDPVKEKGAAAAHGAKEKAAHVAHAVEEKLPEPMRQKAAQAEQAWQDKAPQPVRDHRAALLAGAGAALVAWLLIRRRNRG
ncbi:DUF3618 domain-containing protein [Streptomyces sp. NPDC006129]|uniref:DUF3618 domain-containing protein n=1 Tax=Streptomyces sp. NPDC006129 TaxID=3155348 RepID=UPI00339F7C5F